MEGRVVKPMGEEEKKILAKVHPKASPNAWRYLEDDSEYVVDNNSKGWTSGSISFVPPRSDTTCTVDDAADHWLRVGKQWTASND